MLGACPIAGGSNLAPVVSKWGRNPPRPIYGRVFDPNEWTDLVPRPPLADVPAIVASFKPATFVTEAQLISIGRALTQGIDVLVAWHENDVKHKQGDYDTAEMNRKRAIQADMTTKVGKLRADGKIRYRTGEVYGGWRMKRTGDIDMYIPDTAGDVLILDYDGTKGGTVYEDWASAQVLKETRRIMDGPYKGKPLIIGEYAWGATTNDPDRTRRVAAIQAQVPKIIAALHPEAIVAFDFENLPGEAFVNANEIAALKAAIPA